MKFTMKKQSTIQGVFPRHAWEAGWDVGCFLPPFSREVQS